MTTVSTNSFSNTVDDVIMYGSVVLDLLIEAGAIQGTLMSERNERVNKAIRDLERSLNAIGALQSGRVHG